MNVKERFDAPAEPAPAPMTEKAWESYAIAVERAYRGGYAPPLPPEPLGSVAWHLRYCSPGDERCAPVTRARRADGEFAELEERAR